MEYDEKVLQEFKDAVMDYMYHRFPAENIADVVPTFERIAGSLPVLKAMQSMEQDGYAYLRRAMHLLLDEEELLIKRGGEIHFFGGDSLDSMFNQITGGETDPESEDYTKIPSHLGYGTPVDNSLIWANHDPEDR